MTVGEGPTVMVEPIIHFPRRAQAGKQYLMAVDLRLLTPPDEWPYESDEFKVFVFVDTGPLFVNQPVGENVILLRRSGTTDGPARFLLCAAESQMSGEIKVTLANASGVPLQVIALNRVEVVETSDVALMPMEPAPEDNLLLEISNIVIGHRSERDLWTALREMSQIVNKRGYERICVWYTRDLEGFLTTENCAQLDEYLKQHLLPKGGILLDPLSDVYQRLLWAQVYAGERSYTPEELISIARLHSTAGEALVRVALKNIWNRNSDIPSGTDPWQVASNTYSMLTNAMRDEDLVAVVCGKEMDHFSRARDENSLALLEEAVTDVEFEKYFQAAG